MKLRLHTLGLLAFMIGGLIACNGESSDENSVEPTADQADEPNTIIIKESSELALLMRQMWDENMELRDRVLSGEELVDLSEEYNRIHTANATEPEKITETYHALANAYLQSMETLMNSSEENRVEAFNNMVTTCVNCHKGVSCQGPIPKINRLRIRPTDEA